ncbi:MAG: 5-formyltetrahydrofolate cyclo-ligase [Candidatus Omnitrophota bacterium]|nr:MAG: 5-formyltetrahydrofolate cyclo-ligase [Candidatus Omnitrophota bacterium]
MERGLRPKQCKAEKQRLREEILKKLQSQSPQERARKSKLIKEKVFSLLQFQKAEKVGFYASKEEEVDTWEMMEEVIFSKKIALPYLHKGEILLSYIQSLKGLRKGVYGIYEPCSPNTPIDPNELEIIIVPGVAFDLLNNRLGRGKGYYDRLLKRTLQTFKLGLGFDFQIVERLPVEENDVRVDKVITN